ncbi:MAG: hypothetical protein Q8P67_15250 [archaeon]|nr:hypothetical protein [archaeon]
MGLILKKKEQQEQQEQQQEEVEEKGGKSKNSSKMLPKERDWRMEISRSSNATPKNELKHHPKAAL